MLGRVRGCRAVAGDACGRSSRKARRREKSCAAGRLRRGVRYGAESDLHDRRRYGAGPCDDVADRRGVRQSRLVHAGRERGAHQELFAEQQGDRFRRGRHGAGHGPQDQQQYAGRSARQYGRRVDDGEGRAAGNGDGAATCPMPRREPFMRIRFTGGRSNRSPNSWSRAASMWRSAAGSAISPHAGRTERRSSIGCGRRDTV